MSRFSERVKNYLSILQAAGYTPEYKPSTDPEQVDAEIIVRADINIQIDANSGDAIAVNRNYNADNLKKFYMRSWDLESDDKLLANVKAAIEFVETPENTRK